ncbi:MAG TPA: PD-(D/E)XK nuclease family protein [Geobacteraceae bacterium]
MKPLTFSLSAYQAYQRCEQKYDYGYRQRLRPAVKAIAPERGRILHEYLAVYYRAVAAGAEPLAAHQAGQAQIMAHAPRIKASAAIAHYAGQEEEARTYLELIPAVVNIAERYFIVHGEGDALHFEVLLVEEKMDFEIVAGIKSKSIIDLVFRDRRNDLIWLAEHKTTERVPDSSVRLRDFQTLLYANVLWREKGIHVDGVFWNYLRTKEPAKPHQNRDGRFSKAINIDTTWDIYERAIREAGQDPGAYADVRDRLQGREEVAFFPRYEHVITADPDLLIHDYAVTAQRVRYQSQLWDWGVDRPVRTLNRDCTFCDYYRLCEAAIMGGDTEDILRMRFTTEPEERPVAAIEEEKPA